MWCEKYLEDKRKLRYYNEVINPTLEDQNYLFVLTSLKKEKNYRQDKNELSWAP